MIVLFGIELFSVFFVIVFLFVITTFIITFATIFKQWNKNNKAPRLTVSAKVVTKRNHISRNRSGKHGYRTSTSYFVTFEVESGDRMELHVPSLEYGLLVEGDSGKLTFQGTRYLSFERE